MQNRNRWPPTPLDTMSVNNSKYFLWSLISGEFIDSLETQIF